jgi:glutamyl-tRNA synthetase
MTDTAAPDSRPTRVRIAPSPTGDPHVGTAYIGLLNYIYARQRNGQFVLRIEDTDRTRFVASSEQMIFDALKWVGLTWDEGPDVGGPYGPYRQSERTEIYREHVEILLANGAAYRSFETAEELDAMRHQQIAAKQPPRYNGAHRHLTPDQIAAYIAEGRPFTVRLKVPENTSTTFTDELRGQITFDHNNVDDQVLMKSDGFPTYHLANVVDDHLMHITDVIRAEEWISSTPKHVLLYNAFGWELPRFWHMPLLRNIDKSKISKRKNPVSLVYYRESGYLPEAMLNFLGLMGGGMAQPTEEEIVSKHLNTKEGDIFSLPEMLDKFDFKRISLGGPVFDLVKLKWLNGEYLRKLSPDEFFIALRGNVLSDNYLKSVAKLIHTRVETLGQFGNMTSFLFRDNVMPQDSTWVPKKRTQEESLLVCDELLLALEYCPVWDSETIERLVTSVSAAHTVMQNLSLAEGTRLAYRTAIRHFYNSISNKKARLGSLSEDDRDEFAHTLGTTFDNESTKRSYISAVNSIDTYLQTATNSWAPKDVFMLLRVILTGSTTSPPLTESLVVFGKSRSLDRLRRFLDTQRKQANQRK